VSGRVVLGVACLLGLALGGPQESAEQVARRQLESGREFARQGNYPEALRDFRAVAETHATTSVADDAWLELARYYLDVAGDAAEAQRAVDAILTGYSTSDSAPAAYILAGRLALAEGRQRDQLETALANFDRVTRLFPASDEVPRALQLAGRTLFWAGRYDEALARLGRVAAEYGNHPAAAEASLIAGRILVALGDPVLAMEELQRVRNRWPDSTPAGEALAGLTQLHRLYVRAASTPAYAPTDETPGPARLDDVVGLIATADGRIVWAAESGLGVAAPPGAEVPSSAGRPRGLTIDAAGLPVVIEDRGLRTATGDLLLFAVPRSGTDVNPLDRIVAAVQLSDGDWLVMDDDERALQRFAADGTYVSSLPPSRVSRLTVSFDNRVAGIERDGDAILVFDGAGLLTDQLPLRTPDYDLRDPEDLTFDAFGHLYVLDRDALAVFTPHGVREAGEPTYRLLTLYAPEERQPGWFDRAEAFALDASGTVYLYDDRAHRILVYR